MAHLLSSKTLSLLTESQLVQTKKAFDSQMHAYLV